MTWLGFKPNAVLPWLGLAMVLVVLFTGTLWLLAQQRVRLLEDSERRARDDISLIRSFVHEALQKGNYQIIDNLLREWGEKQRDIYEITLTSANGFLLGSYRRAAEAIRPYRLSQQIPYSYKGLAGLELVTDRAWITQRMDRLKNQLFSAAVVIGIVLWLLLWLGLHRVAEAKALRARTEELKQANERLQTEMSRRARTEEQLRESEEHLRLTLENAPIGIATADLQGRLVSVNPAFCNILGYSEEELLRRSIKDITHPDDRQETGERFQSLVRGDIPSYELDKRYIRKDGTIITGHARGALVRDGQGRPFRVVGEVEDITERKRAEEMFRLVVELAPNAIVMVDPDGRIVLINSQTETFFGYAREELIGQPVEILIPGRWRGRHPSYRHNFLSEHHARAMGAGRELFGLRKDGSEFPIEIGLSPIETNQGTLVLSAIVDISERKRAAQEVQRMRAYLKNIVDSMPSILVGVDTEGRITEWNRGAEQATGVPADSAIGNGFADLLPAYESQLRSLPDAIRKSEPVRTERMITEQGGETRFTDVVVYPLTANGVVGGVIRVDDVTNRVRIEQMMVQTEKMMTVGGLAAGMAHEINNPLSGILQSCQNIERRVSPELPANRVTAESLGQTLNGIHAYMTERGILDFVEGIRDAAERASRIVADMLTFSRRSGTELMPVALDEMLNAVVRLAGSDYDLKKKYDFRQIEVVRDYDPELEAVPCNRTEIEQVILNLIKNAAHAMVEGDLQLRRITLRTRRDGDFARIEVEDTGPGMDDDTRRRVFDPFFTTKPAGSGTGLGLSVSYFIVTEQHHGAMSVASKPGQGTCFVVRLPLQMEDTA